MTKKEDKETLQSTKEGLDGVIEALPLSKFSNEAKKTLKKFTLEYFDDLYHLSKRTTEKRGAQQISDEDVKTSARCLTPTHQNWKMFLLFLAAPGLIGFSLTETYHLLSNIETKPISAIEFIFVFGAFGLGSILLTIYIKNQ